MKRTILIIVLAATAAFAAGTALAECQRGEEKTAFYRQCVEKQNCSFNPIPVCPDGLRDREGYNACAAEVNEAFLACLENCLNRSNVAFGCPLQHIPRS